jgi:hypothetical protein
MEAPITVAVISSATAVLTAIYAFYTRKTLDRNLEEFKASLNEKLKENDALRDYKYEARKRLYNEYEPLFFQFTELSESALERIAGLARTARLNNLGAGGWMFDEYYFSSTIYRLLAPLSIFRIIADKLTFIDFSLDMRISFQHNLMKILSHSFSEDFEFAGLGNFTYNPNTEGWKEKRLKDEQSFWRQGIPAGRLETAINALIVSDGSLRKHILSFGEFETKYYTDPGFKKSFEVVNDVFYNFHPGNRPVLWAILFTQARLYGAFLKLQGNTFENNESLMATVADWPDEEWEKLSWKDAGNSEELEKYKNISREYLNSRIGKYMSKMASFNK